MKIADAVKQILPAAYTRCPVCGRPTDVEIWWDSYEGDDGRDLSWREHDIEINCNDINCEGTHGIVGVVRDYVDFYPAYTVKSSDIIIYKNVDACIDDDIIVEFARSTKKR